MTSTLGPIPASFSPINHEYSGNSCNILPGLVLNDQQSSFLAWRNNVSQQPHKAYPSPPTSHEVDLQELSSMDALCLPPFWETRRDSDLTIRLISAQQSECRAECCLIRRCLHRVMIKQELYGRLDKCTTQRVHKADVSLGIACGVLRSSGLTPAGKSFDDIDSDTFSALHGSGAESDTESEPGAESDAS